jgi:hypothetical protein
MLKLGFSRSNLGGQNYEVCYIGFLFCPFNGERLQEFKPTRGIRQGEPISPYLFLLCAEGLSCVLEVEGADCHINGAQLYFFFLYVVLVDS